jgi:hypothetical protein
MAEMRFTGVVRGYTQGDDNMVHLSIDDASPSEKAKYFVHDLERTFNPNSPAFGYGSKDVPCNIKPGFSSYRFTVTPDMVRGITHGCYVDVQVDVYNVRKVKFYNRRWAAISEVRYDLIAIKPTGGDMKPDAKLETAGKSGK